MSADPLRFLTHELGFSEPRSYFVSRDSHTTYTRDADEVDIVWDGAPTPIVAVRVSGGEVEAEAEARARRANG